MKKPKPPTKPSDKEWLKQQIKASLKQPSPFEKPSRELLDCSKALGQLTPVAGRALPSEYLPPLF